jgi:hypothetical protein
MKKTYSESELKGNQVKAAFEQYPDAKKVFATTDGNVFLSENRANLHAGAKGTVFTFEKVEKVEKAAKAEITAKQESTKPLNATDTIAAIDACKTLEDLKAFEGDERKTVLEAYNKKSEALAEALKVVGAENVTK